MLWGGYNNALDLSSSYVKNAIGHEDELSSEVIIHMCKSSIKVEGSDKLARLFLIKHSQFSY
jgi:hypothetical protein